MEFIKKDLALKLKFRGFDKPVFGFYANNDDNLLLYDSYDSGDTYEDLLGIPSDYCVPAPTIDQTLQWLRDQSIYVTALPKDETHFELVIKSVGRVFEKKVETYAMVLSYDSYNDAILDGIEYVVEHIL